MVNIIRSRGLPRANVMPVGTSKLAAFFKIEAIKPDGRKRLVADWQPNLITNSGLDQCGWGNKGGYIGQEIRWIYWCSLGTGSTEPAFTDTALATFRAQATTIGYVNGTVEVTPNVLYYRYQKNTYRFAQGVADGIITEIGIGMKNGHGALTTRALIRDTNGDPQQVVITPDEQVDVTYEFRTYIDAITPVDTQAIINGVLYDIKSCPMDVLSTNNMNGTFHYGGGINSIFGYQGDVLPNLGLENNPTGVDPHLTGPTSNYGNGTANPSVYQNGDHYMDATLILPYTEWYWGPKGFTAAAPKGRMQHWQMSFTQNLDPTMGIPHDDTNELIMSFRHHWARYTPP